MRLVTLSTDDINTMLLHCGVTSMGSLSGFVLRLNCYPLLYVLFSDITAPGRSQSTLSLDDTGLCWGFAGLGPLRLWRLAHWISGRRRALCRSTNERISDIRVTHDEYGK